MPINQLTYEGFGFLAGGFSPSNIDGLLLWVNADAANVNTGSPNDLDAVDVLENLGTGATNATQTDSARRPIWNSTGFGTKSKPYLKFQNIYYLTLGTEYSKLEQHTVFYVFELDADGIQQAIIAEKSSVLNDSESTGITKTVRTDDKLFYSFGVTGSTHSSGESATLLASTPYINVETYTTGDTFTVDTVNGAVASRTPFFSTNPATSIGGTKSNLNIGRLGDATQGDYLNGKVAEVLIYDSPLTSAQIQSVDDYLTTKYFGIPVGAFSNAFSNAFNIT